MIDVDYAPAVFFGIIVFVFLAPAIYGMTLVDKFWKKHKEEASEDVFN
jgi:hypothetical protein